MRSTNSKDKYKKGYAKGYTNGFIMGCSYGCESTYILPQEKSKRLSLYKYEYDRGYGAGFYAGHKQRFPHYQKFTYLESFPKQLKPVSCERKDTGRVINNISNMIDGFIDYSMEQAFFKDYRTIYIDGKAHTYSPANLPNDGTNNNTNIDKDSFRTILKTFSQNDISFIYRLKHDIKGYILRKLLVQVVYIYDGEMSKISCHNAFDLSSHFIDQYILLIKDEGFDKSKPTIWRHKKKLKDIIIQLKAMADTPINRTGIHFDLISFLSSDLAFVQSSNKYTESLFMPETFAGYIGLIIETLSKKLNLFTHCETYINNQLLSKNKNRTRDYENITRTYIGYSQIVDKIVDKLQWGSSLAQYISVEFLLSTALLHRQFFSSLDSELFDYLSKRINLHGSSASNKLNLPKSNIYYDLLKYLFYFDIDMDALFTSIFSSEDNFICDEFIGLIPYETISHDSQIPLSFIHDFLHEVHSNIGGILNNAIDEFYSFIKPLPQIVIPSQSGNLTDRSFEGTYVSIPAIHPFKNVPRIDLPLTIVSRLNALADHIYSSNLIYYNKYINDDTDISELSDVDFQQTTSQNQALLISHLIHQSAFEK